VLITTHILSKTFGALVHVATHSRSSIPGGELEVRAYVRDLDDSDEMRRIGSALLGVAPTALHKPHALLLRGALKEASKEGGPAARAAARAASIEERADFKLVRERRTDKEREVAASSAKRPGNPFALADPERMSYVLYKTDSSGGIEWTRVPPP